MMRSIPLASLFACAVAFADPDSLRTSSFANPKVFEGWPKPSYGQIDRKFPCDRYVEWGSDSLKVRLYTLQDFTQKDGYGPHYAAAWKNGELVFAGESHLLAQSDDSDLRTLGFDLPRQIDRARIQFDLARWEFGSVLRVGSAWNHGTSWSSARSYPYLVGASSILPANTALIPATEPTGSIGEFLVVVRKGVAPHWHVQPEFGIAFSTLETGRDPGGQVSLEWQSVDLELGLSAGWNTLPGVWQFGARAGAGMVVAMSDSVYLNVGGTHKGVFTGLNPSSVAPRIKAEASVRYRRLELGLDAIDDFGDLDGTPSGTIKAWGVGIELAYFWH